MNYTYWEDGKLYTVDRKDVADMMRSTIRNEMYDRQRTGTCVCPDFMLCHDACAHCQYCRRGIIDSMDAPVGADDDGGDLIMEFIDKRASVEDQVIWKITVENVCAFLDGKEAGLSEIFLLLISGYSEYKITDYFGIQCDVIKNRVRGIRRLLTPVRDELVGF